MKKSNWIVNIEEMLLVNIAKMKVMPIKFDAERKELKAFHDNAWMLVKPVILEQFLKELDKAADKAILGAEEILSDSMSDKEILLDMFKKRLDWDISKCVQQSKHSFSLMSGSTPKIDGYRGFATDFIFDEDGTLIKVGSYG